MSFVRAGFESPAAPFAPASAPSGLNWPREGAGCAARGEGRVFMGKKDTVNPFQKKKEIKEKKKNPNHRHHTPLLFACMGHAYVHAGPGSELWS